jgi:hypothetical protein
MDDLKIIRNVVARLPNAAKFEVRIQVSHESTADTVARIMAKINQLGRVGHSFGIKSDSDEGSLGSWDGDGHDYVLGIKIVELETGDEERVSLDR